MDAPAGSTAASDSSALRKDPSAEEDVLVAAPLRVGGPLASRRTLVMIGGGVAVLAIVLIVALTRGGSSTEQAREKGATSANALAEGKGHDGHATQGADEQSATSMKLPSHAGAAAATGAAPVAVGSAAAEVPVGSDEMGSGSAAATAEPSTGSDGESAPAHEAPRHHPTLGGRQVVLEYDTPTHEAPRAAPAPKEDSADIAKARASYAAGNQRLFAGDAAGAVRAYQQALAYYPGYVAGYRGLGLAYSQQGDKARALHAFHTYLSSVPGAKDAPLIRKRVTALSH